MEIDRKITFLGPLRYVFEASVHFKVGRSSSSYVKWKNTMTCNVNFLTQNVGSETRLVKMWKLTEKSHFCALSVMFLRLVCILKLEGLLQAMLSGKTQWRVMSTFWHKMSDLKPGCSMWKLTEKSHFCALSVMFLRLVCILKLEGLLQGYVKWKNTMTCNVNFLTQNVGSETRLLD